MHKTFDSSTHGIDEIEPCDRQRLNDPSKSHGDTLIFVILIYIFIIVGCTNKQERHVRNYCLKES